MTMCVIEACSSRSTLTCSGSRVHSSTRHCGISCTAASLTQLPISPLHSQQHLQSVCAAAMSPLQTLQRGMCSSKSCPVHSAVCVLWHVQQQPLLHSSAASAFDMSTGKQLQSACAEGHDMSAALSMQPLFPKCPLQTVQCLSLMLKSMQHGAGNANPCEGKEKG